MSATTNKGDTTGEPTLPPQPSKKPFDWPELRGLVPASQSPTLDIPQPDAVAAKAKKRMSAKPGAPQKRVVHDSSAPRATHLASIAELPIQHHLPRVRGGGGVAFNFDNQGAGVAAGSALRRSHDVHLSLSADPHFDGHSRPLVPSNTVDLSNATNRTGKPRPLSGGAAHSPKDGVGAAAGQVTLGVGGTMILGRLPLKHPINLPRSQLLLREAATRRAAEAEVQSARAHVDRKGAKWEFRQPAMPSQRVIAVPAQPAASAASGGSRNNSRSQSPTSVAQLGPSHSARRPPLPVAPPAPDPSVAHFSPPPPHRQSLPGMTTTFKPKRFPQAVLPSNGTAPQVGAPVQLVVTHARNPAAGTAPAPRNADAEASQLLDALERSVAAERAAKEEVRRAHRRVVDCFRGLVLTFHSGERSRHEAGLPPASPLSGTGTSVATAKCSVVVHMLACHIQAFARAHLSRQFVQTAREVGGAPSALAFRASLAHSLPPTLDTRMLAQSSTPLSENTAADASTPLSCAAAATVDFAGGDAASTTQLDSATIAHLKQLYFQYYDCDSLTLVVEQPAHTKEHVDDVVGAATMRRRREVGSAPQRRVAAGQQLVPPMSSNAPDLTPVTAAAMQTVYAEITGHGGESDEESPSRAPPLPPADLYHVIEEENVLLPSSPAAGYGGAGNPLLPLPLGSFVEEDDGCVGADFSARRGQLDDVIEDLVGTGAASGTSPLSGVDPLSGRNARGGGAEVDSECGSPNSLTFDAERERRFIYGSLSPEDVVE